MVAEKIETKYGFSHYVGADAESKVLKNTQNNFVVVCGYGRIGKMVCDLFDRKFIPYIAFDIDPKKVSKKVHVRPESNVLSITKNLIMMSWVPLLRRL